jgi:sulfite exporter TauE/SafE
VTRTDVQQAAQYIRRVPATASSRYSSIKLTAQTYIVLGVLIFVGGLAWPYLRSAYVRDRFSFMFSIAGLMMSILGFLMLEILRIRKKRAEMFDLTKQDFSDATGARKGATPKSLQTKS